MVHSIGTRAVVYFVLMAMSGLCRGAIDRQVVLD